MANRPRVRVTPSVTSTVRSSTMTGSEGDLQTNRSDRGVSTGRPPTEIAPRGLLPGCSPNRPRSFNYCGRRPITRRRRPARYTVGLMANPFRLGYLVPEFPRQTHIFFWRECEELRRRG